MAVFKVGIPELENAASKIGQANQNFRDAAAALKAAADALSETWEGGAHDAFVAEQEQIDQWYKTMADVVDGFVAAMKQTAAEYVETDHSVAAEIKSH